MRATLQVTRQAAISEEHARELARRISNPVVASQVISAVGHQPALLDKRAAEIVWEALSAWIAEEFADGVPAELERMERALRAIS